MSPLLYFILGCLIGGVGIGLLLRWVFRKAVEHAVGKGLGW